MKRTKKERNTALLNEAISIAFQVELNKRVDFLVSRLCKMYALSPKDILSKARKGSKPRDILFYLLHEAGYTFQNLASAFGRSNHTGPLRSYYRVKHLISNDTFHARRIRNTLSALRAADDEYTKNRTKEIAELYAKREINNEDIVSKNQ